MINWSEMRVFDLHSHWGTQKGYRLRTDDDLRARPPGPSERAREHARDDAREAARRRATAAHARASYDAPHAALSAHSASESSALAHRTFKPRIRATRHQAIVLTLPAFARFPAIAVRR